MIRKHQHLAARATAAIVVGGLALVGCSSSSAPSGGATASESGSLTVFAAASLTEAFNSLGATFRAAHPGVNLEFSFGGSPTLAQQIVNGAPADVFAAASQATMKTVIDAGKGAGQPTIFAKNSMIIVTPPTDSKVTSLASFADPALTVVLCASAVPCGVAADKVFAKAGVVPAPDSREPDVKSVLAKVESGDADGGIVYVTDAKSAGSKVTAISIPEAQNQSTSYPIVAVTGGDSSSLAAQWIALVTGPEGQQVLASDGFASP